MKSLTMVCIAAAATCFVLTGAAQTSPNTKMQTAQHFQAQTTHTIELNYLLFLPVGYKADTGKKWPLILFLHGAGERGSDIWKVAVHGPPKHVATHPDFPFIVVSPQCPEGRIWSNESLLALLEEVMAHHAVDPARVYLTGLSMGGYGTWELGLSHPDKFAAIVPICGGGELITVLLSNGTKSAALKSLGVWAFHGGKDPVVPVSESQRMVDLLKKTGVTDTRLTIYPDAGHDSWTETYSNPELYEWLLKHERKQASR
jgi:predicted peptidase